ncbi:hypothetical protein ACEZCY_11145 [Streptacidiphilus sp. N1-12]|uniref:Uncharacterized protein n=2 Tax=Streptacidiphilus alkalitolerans TaxID=3342712 RepID=A0ABV6WDI5_9ACTN
MSTTGDQGFYSLKLQWPTEQPKARPANQFALGLGIPTKIGNPDAIYLVIGHAEPPFISPAELPTEGEEIEPVGIEVLGRYVMTRSRLGELIDMLQQAADIFDQALGGEFDAEQSV